MTTTTDVPNELTVELMGPRANQCAIRAFGSNQPHRLQGIILTETDVQGKTTATIVNFACAECFQIFHIPGMAARVAAQSA